MEYRNIYKPPKPCVYMVKKRCDGCGNLARELRRHGGKFYCFKCYTKQVSILNFREWKFEEPLSEHTYVCLILTKSQKKLLKKRLKFLYPTKKRPIIAEYIRSLVLHDLLRWEKSLTS